MSFYPKELWDTSPTPFTTPGGEPVAIVTPPEPRAPRSHQDLEDMVNSVHVSCRVPRWVNLTAEEKEKLEGITQRFFLYQVSLAVAGKFMDLQKGTPGAWNFPESWGDRG